MSLARQIVIARAPLAAFAAMGILWGVYAALVPDIKAMLGASDAAFGSLLLATPIAAVIAMLAAPMIAGRMGRHVLPIAVVLLSCSFFFPGRTDTAALFALGMVAVGATNGFLDVTMNARVSALETARGLHLMNLNHAAYSFGYAFAAIATGWARAQGFPPSEILGTAALASAACALLTFEGATNVNGFSRGTGVMGRLGWVPFWGGIIALIAFMSENAAENWSALHIERTLGGTVQEGSFGPAIMALTAGIGRVAGQLVVARIDEMLLMRLGTVVAAAGLAMAGLAPTPALAWVGLIVTGLGGSVIAPTAFAAVGRLADPDRRALAIARATALGYLGYFFGPPVLGLVSEGFGLRAAFVGMAVVVLGVLVLFPCLVASGRKAAAVPAPPPAPETA